MDTFSVARLERMESSQLAELRQQLKHARQMLWYWQRYPDIAATWADRADALRLEILRTERAC